MAELRVFVERRMAAPREVVYRCVADFAEHHWRFLPDTFFDYKVEEGGFGAGTVVSFKGKTPGKPRAFRTKCEEPEPGRILVERDLLSPTVTTTRIDPDGEGCRVSFETVWENAKGFQGLVERLLARPMMRRIYREELSRLERYAQELAAAEAEAAQAGTAAPTDA